MKYLCVIAFVTLLIVGCSNNTLDSSATNTNANKDITPIASTSSPIISESKNNDIKDSNDEVELEEDDSSSRSTPANPSTAVPVNPTPSGITNSELSQHNSVNDCWIAYNGKVYDLTSYLPVHPGGVNKILTTCGTSAEFENAFTRKHGTSKVSMLESQGEFKGDLV